MTDDRQPAEILRSPLGDTPPRRLGRGAVVFVVVLAFLVVVAAACTSAGGEATVDGVPDQTSAPGTTNPGSGSAETTVSVVLPTTSTSTAITTTVAGSPAIAALTSGRGDDGSLEVGIWFSSNPFETGVVRLLVGTDSDSSYPGTGDPVPHLDGWAEVVDVEVTLLDEGTAIADEATGGLDEWLSWTGPGQVIWVYFLSNVPVRAGTVWVALEIDGEVVAGGVAGAPIGDGCSFHSAGIDLGPVPGDVPDLGVPCRYPLD